MKMTAEQELIELEMKHAREREQLEIKQKVMKELPHAQAVSHILVSKLYDREVTVTYVENDAARLAALIDDLPLPLEAAIARDTFTSFRTAAHCLDSGAKQVEKIFPYFIDVDPNRHSDCATIKWFCMVAGFVTEMRLKIELERLRPHVVAQVVHRTVPGATYVESTTLDLADGFSPVAPGRQIVKWARGGNEYAHHFTVYWSSLGSWNQSELAAARDAFAQMLRGLYPTKEEKPC